MWIEIPTTREIGDGVGSRPARALWIEIIKPRSYRKRRTMSRPARALWIEIVSITIMPNPAPVEAREGLVD